MKLIAFSDSHHDVSSMGYIIEEENPDLVLHLGDNICDLRDIKEQFPDKKFEYVAGNCDFEAADKERSLKIDGLNLLMSHGHNYGVKNGYDRITRKGKEENADLVLFGHTHIAYVNKVDNMWLVNPGSISNVCTRDFEKSFARIIIENGRADCTIVRR